MRVFEGWSYCPFLIMCIDNGMKVLLFPWLTNGLNLNVFPNGTSSYWLMSGSATSSVILPLSFMALLVKIEGTSSLCFPSFFSPQLMLACEHHMALSTSTYERKMDLLSQQSTSYCVFESVFTFHRA